MLEIINKQEKRRKRIKYTIAGFNQIEAIKMGLSTDDLTVLRWFIDYKDSNTMNRDYIEKVNDMGFWVDYGTLIDALPILLSDGNTYLERFIELERLLQDGKFDEYKAKRKKYHSTNSKKIQRVLAGPLSQILQKDNMRVISEKGSKIFVYVNRENYSKLLLDTNMQTYLEENGISVDEKTVEDVDKSLETKRMEDKSVLPGEDRSVLPGEDRSVLPGEDRSVLPGEDKSVLPNSSIINSSIIDSSIKDSSIVHSKDDGVDLNFFYELDNGKKNTFLMNQFDMSSDMLQNIIMVVDMGVEEKTIKSKIGSKGYWKYIYKICEDRHKKRLTDLGINR